MGALRSIFTSELFSFNFCSELEILGELRRADSLMFRVPPETEGRPGWRPAAPAGGGRAVPREVAGLGPVSLQPSRWPLRGSLLPVSSGPTREGTMAWQARGSTTPGLRSLTHSTGAEILTDIIHQAGNSGFLHPLETFHYIPSVFSTSGLHHPATGNHVRDKKHPSHIFSPQDLSSQLLTVRTTTRTGQRSHQEL